ncbi:hypothetical protein CHU98_g10901 [Xylaria longipes]|nr:hypothetical protein CHU98_g10901 [Xylaria longipes]
MVVDHVRRLDARYVAGTIGNARPTVTVSNRKDGHDIGQEEVVLHLTQWKGYDGDGGISNIEADERLSASGPRYYWCDGREDRRTSGGGGNGSGGNSGGGGDGDDDDYDDDDDDDDGGGGGGNDVRWWWMSVDMDEDPRRHGETWASSCIEELENAKSLFVPKINPGCHMRLKSDRRGADVRAYLHKSKARTGATEGDGGADVMYYPWTLPRYRLRGHNVRASYRYCPPEPLGTLYYLATAVNPPLRYSVQFSTNDGSSRPPVYYSGCAGTMNCDGKCPMSNVQCPMSNVQRPTSNVSPALPHKNPHDRQPHTAPARTADLSNSTYLPTVPICSALPALLYLFTTKLHHHEHHDTTTPRHHDTTTPRHRDTATLQRHCNTR